ncbi:acyl-CoA oxidase [Aspergillus neoniger CBS 115656]|uniref:Acyl-CoA oxidase n=1 Tax=Aspergillus neoniger (strain CBS 115656) TaxID=1448310 RepID=A0A318YG60_ASPNB|nr:acyl-CoA oxidase [Aspergillus neoniger CBS 115656]PYH31550.1 acyl-CoA oxidase [Aspergillus neoniger CBS 115656]
MQSHHSFNSSTLSLLSSKLFEHHYEDGPRIEELERSYHRARAIGQLHGVTLEACLHMTPKFWAVHKDGIIVRDAVSHILVTIQLNLVAGTVAPFALKRPDLHPLMKEILNFEISAPFILMKLAMAAIPGIWRPRQHCSVMAASSSIRLHLRQFMPPSMPIKGIRRVAIVCARLIVDEEDRGIRTFVVPINNGTEMNKGVHSWLLPSINGGRVLDRSLTSFDNVHLPTNAMLGELAMPADMRAQYLSAIHRLGTGALALSLWIIPFLKCAAYCVGKYSQRRTVQADNSLHPGAKHGLGVIIKAVFLQNGQWSLANLIERSGAQGVYPHNQMATFEVLTRATGIAEGEVLVLSIRLATELLLGRYAIPGPKKPNSILAQHEKGIVSDLKKKLKKIGNHRGDEYSKQVLPHLRPMVIAIGQRMAYEAAVDASVDPDLLALYEAGAMKSDPAWFSEHLRMSRDAQFQKECDAVDAVYRRLDEHPNNLQIEPYITAPMLSAERWMGIIKAVPEFTGNGEMSFPGAQEFQSKL